MSDSYLDEPIDNRPYQSQFADGLLACMERDDAIDFCVANEWMGVLDQLLNTKPRS